MDSGGFMLGTCQSEAAPNGAELPGALNGAEPTFAVTFTRIVSVLMRSIHYKHYSLSDLEWLVLPPLLAGQYAILDAKVNDRPVPVALALWASVSEEVDRRLSENLTAPAKLRPDEWRSGEILWLIDAVGDVKALPHLLRELQETAFKGRDVKVRRLGPDGCACVGLLNHSPAN
jgi:cytolysin-activating lysine-acyltransferase